MEAVFASPDALVAVGDGGGMWPGSRGAVRHASTGAPQPLPGGDPTTGCSCPVLQLRTRLIEELRAEGIAGGSDTKVLTYVHPAACLHLRALIAGLVIPASCHVTVGRCVRTASNTACAAMAAALAAAAAISIEFDVAEVLVVSTDRLGSSGNCSVLSVHPLGRDGSSP